MHILDLLNPCNFLSAHFTHCLEKNHPPVKLPKKYIAFGQWLAQGQLWWSVSYSTMIQLKHIHIALLILPLPQQDIQMKRIHYSLLYFQVTVYVNYNRSQIPLSCKGIGLSLIIIFSQLQVTSMRLYAWVCMGPSGYCLRIFIPSQKRSEVLHVHTYREFVSVQYHRSHPAHGTSRNIIHAWKQPFLSKHLHKPNLTHS